MESQKKKHRRNSTAGRNHAGVLDGKRQGGTMETENNKDRQKGDDM